MSVLAQAKGTLNSIARKFQDMSGRCQDGSADTGKKLKEVAGAMAQMETASRELKGSIAAVIANTQSSDRHSAAAKAGLAETKCKAAVQSCNAALQAVKDARIALTNAQSAVGSTAASL